MCQRTWSSTQSHYQTHQPVGGGGGGGGGEREGGEKDRGREGRERESSQNVSIEQKMNLVFTTTGETYKIGERGSQ